MRFICLVMIMFIASAGSARAQQPSVMTLDRALAHAYHHNPQLQSARYRLEEIYELYPQAKAGRLPTIFGESGIFATNVKNSNFGSADGATTKDFTLGINQPIWLGGRTNAQIAQSRELIRAAEAVYIQTRQDVFLDVIAAYMNVVTFRELLNLRRQNEDILKREYDAAAERRAIGDVTSTDVQQASARLSRATTLRIQAEKDYDLGKAEFEAVAGFAPSMDMAVPYIDNGVANDAESLVKTALENNPEIIQARHELAAADHNTAIQNSDLFPQISAYASVNQQYDPQPGIVDRSSSETIGLRATLSLYEGGAMRSRIREARKAERRYYYDLEEARQKVRQDVISHFRSYQSAMAETEARKQEIEAAESALRGVREESRLGQRTVLDILDADEEVINAKIGLIESRRDEVIAKARLLASMGMLDRKSLTIN